MIAPYLILLVILPLMVIFARRKGFNPWAWVFATGVPGLVILMLMPSALASNIDRAKSEKRRKIGDTVGIVLSVVMVIAGLALAVFASGWQTEAPSNVPKIPVDASFERAERNCLLPESRFEEAS